jgi:hypothetical protein
MDRLSARDLLGVPDEATAEEILDAYQRRGRELKQGVTEARSLEARDRARRALRNLVLLRDLALEPRDARAFRRRQAVEREALRDDGWQPADGVPMAVPDREAALSWLGLEGGAAPETIRRVLETRAHGLRLRIARAGTEYDLRLWQQTLVDLRRLASLVLEETTAERPPFTR